MSGFVLLIIIAAVLALYILSLYNQFVTIKTRIKASIQEIGNQLKRQADLIPNLVSSVKGYMKHEKTIFDELTNARKEIIKVVDSGNTQKMVDASARLENALAPIRAVFESTPQLQAVGPATQLMEELRDTADKVMYSRRILIDLTADYNIKIVTFPSNLVAKIFGFKEEAGIKMPEEGESLSVSKEQLKTPKVEI
ncbi:MAG: LemA family protein [Candidatus Shapirobacteria bacterium]|nr:LemA family protein [Candidatus Shapirobacteria bacterium]